jgi:hypothetical protein
MRAAVSAIIANTATIPGKCTHHEFRSPRFNMAATKKYYREDAKIAKLREELSI